MSAPIFSYHSGYQAIVYPHPQTGQLTVTQTVAIRAAGWIANDLQLARCLPRFQPQGPQEQQQKGRIWTP
jgi:hypothetical protein